MSDVYGSWRARRRSHVHTQWRPWLQKRVSPDQETTIPFSRVPWSRLPGHDTAECDALLDLGFNPVEGKGKADHGTVNLNTSQTHWQLLPSTASPSCVARAFSHKLHFLFDLPERYLLLSHKSVLIL